MKFGRGKHGTNNKEAEYIIDGRMSVQDERVEISCSSYNSLRDMIENSSGKEKE